MNNDSHIPFGDILRRARLDAGLNQRTVAERMGVDAATVSRMESHPTLPKRARVEAYLALGLQLDRAEVDHHLQIYEAMQLEPVPVQQLSKKGVVKSAAYLACLRRLEDQAAEAGFGLVGTPHIFLDLYFAEQKCVLYLYDSLNVDLQPVVSAMRSRMAAGPSKGSGVLRGYTLEALQVKGLAEEMARQEKTAVSTQHLWQALFAQEHTLLACLLEQAGYSRVQICAALHRPS